jgi:hypothetical protein
MRKYPKWFRIVYASVLVGSVIFSCMLASYLIYLSFLGME